MDGQGDGWHNGPNSVRLPLPRGLRPPNDEPNMEFIAILDFIVNQEIIFVNEPEQWDLDDNNQNDNPIHINNVNVQENVFIGPIVDNALVNQPHAAVGAMVQMEVNQRSEAVENLSDQSREHPRNNDDEITSNGKKGHNSDHTSDSEEDIDEANKEPRPGPSQQRSEGDENNRKKPDSHFLWWHEFHPKSSDSSPEFDLYEVNPLLSGSNHSLDSQDENEEMESKPSGEFSMIGQHANDLSQSIINSDPTDIVSDCEERLKDFIGLEETEDESQLESFSESSKCRHETERGSCKLFQWAHKCDNDISDKGIDQAHPEEKSPIYGPDQGTRDNPNSEQPTFRLPNEFTDPPEPDCQSSSTKKEEVSSDEDPLLGPSSWISFDKDGHKSGTMSSNRFRWWHEFCPNSSDSSTDVEDTDGVPMAGASRKRCGYEDEEETETRISKRFRFGYGGDSDDTTDGEDTEEEWKGSSENLHSNQTKGKKRLNQKCHSNPSTCKKNCYQDLAATLSDQEIEDDSQSAPGKERLLQIDKGCVKDFQDGHVCQHKSSDDIDSEAALAQPLKLGDNLALLSLGSHLSQRKQKTVRFHKETTSQDIDQEPDEDILPMQPHETLSEDENASDKQ